MPDLNSLLSALDIKRAIITVVFILLMLTVRWLLVRFIRRDADILNEAQRKWISQVKNGFFVALLISLAVIWLPEIETFALSITAVAVALVIATKELILCLSGTVYRTSTNLFQISDWIEVGPHFGEVVDQSIASTVLQQVDRQEYVHTGQSVVLPNSMLLTHSVTNHSFQKRYVFHSFELTIEPGANPFEIVDDLRRLIQEQSVDFSDLAARYNSMIVKRSGIDIPSSAPRFLVKTTDIGKPVLKVTLFCPTNRATHIQNAVTGEFFKWHIETIRRPNLGAKASGKSVGKEPIR